MSDSEDAGTSRNAEEGDSPAPGEGGAILIVESNPMLRDYLQHLLRSRFRHASITAVKTAREALPRLRSSPPDIIFVHVRPGDEGGFELIGTFRHAAPAAQMIFLSDYDGPEYRDAAMRSGADHYLEKGAVGIDDIVGLVRSAGGAALNA